MDEVALYVGRHVCHSPFPRSAVVLDCRGPRVDSLRRLYGPDWNEWPNRPAPDYDQHGLLLWEGRVDTDPGDGLRWWGGFRELTCEEVDEARAATLLQAGVMVAMRCVPPTLDQVLEAGDADAFHGPVLSPKYQVHRLDGTVPTFPFFVLGARDPAAHAALRAYIRAGHRRRYDSTYLAGLVRQVLVFEVCARGAGDTDPSRDEVQRAPVGVPEHALAEGRR